MLRPNSDRLDYGSLLMPPEGYRLDKALATSYSLDLDALISIPVALYYAHSLDLDLKQDTIQILNSIKKASSAFKIFCQKGQIKVPDNQHKLYHFIESCIIQVAPTLKRSFHPKIWVLRYKNNENEIKYRFIILSRNLTFDRSWDIAFFIDGHCNIKRQNSVRNTKPLVDFIKYLSHLEHIEWIEEFISDLSKTEFTLNSNEFEDFTFLPTGFNGYQNNILFDGNLYDELLIMSPFIANGALELAKNHSNSKPYLFSREAELLKSNQELLKHFRVYHLVNNFVEGEEKLESDTAENAITQMQDVHAKIYSYKNGWDAFLLLGSANCSRRAMESNVEFMIQLSGKNSKIGPGAIFKELVNDDLNVFQEYEKKTLSSETDPLQSQKEQELQELKIQLVNSKVRGKAVPQTDLNFRIDFEYDLGNINVNTQIEVSIYLFQNAQQKQLLKLNEINKWAIHNIAEPDISCFIIVELYYKDYTSLNFAIKIQIDDLPITRNTRVFKDIISNSANFFKYIRFLLADNYWDEQLSFNSDPCNKALNGLTGDYFFYEEPIYENMLKAISREPEKLTEIKEIMDELNTEENKEELIIPEDFQKLWNVFNESIKKVNGDQSK